MAAVTTIEARLCVELERKYLSHPGPLPHALSADATPALLVKQRWGSVRAADLMALLQPWTERPAFDCDIITKVAGARYVLLLGVVDEPWVKVMVDDGAGRLSPWRKSDADCPKPLLTIIGTEQELNRLALPRTALEIERLLRRGSALAKEVDWILSAALGISIPDLAAWLANLAAVKPLAFVAFGRRDVSMGLHYLQDEKGRVTAPDIRHARSLRNLYEIARLVELMRSMSGDGRATAEDLLHVLRTADDMGHRMRRDDPGGQYLANGWMFMRTIHTHRNHIGPRLDQAFPLEAYARRPLPPTVGINHAIKDPATFTFYTEGLGSEYIVSGTTRTLFPIDGEQPIDFFAGIELLRLPFIALRAIARKSGCRSALNNTNRCLLGRLALFLLREIDPRAFAAYADRWEQTHAVQSAGLKAHDLSKGLCSPILVYDVASAMVVKTEKVRRLVSLTAESAFDPCFWVRKPACASWQGYHRLACSPAHPQSGTNTLRQQVFASVSELGTDLVRLFEGDAATIAEAVSICAAVGAHGTPLSRDPGLFAFALRQASNASVGKSGQSRSSGSRLKIVPRVRKIATRRPRNKSATK